jgi:hypothetical protein
VAPKPVVVAAKPGAVAPAIAVVKPAVAPPKPGAVTSKAGTSKTEPETLATGATGGEPKSANIQACPELSGVQPDLQLSAPVLFR